LQECQPGEGHTSLSKSRSRSTCHDHNLEGCTPHVFCRNVSNFNANIFGAWHQSIKIEVLEVNGAEMCAWARKHAVEKKLDKFKGCSVGSHIARKAMQLPPIVMQVQSGSSFSERTLHTTMVWQISFFLWHGMSWQLIRKKVLVPATRFVLGEGPVPMPWHSRPSSLV
jgi:hypothetical protein